MSPDPVFGPAVGVDHSRPAPAVELQAEMVLDRPVRKEFQGRHRIFEHGRLPSLVSRALDGILHERSRGASLKPEGQAADDEKRKYLHRSKEVIAPLIELLLSTVDIIMLNRLPVPASHLVPESGISPPDPIALLLQDKRSENTRRAYAADLRAFFGGEPSQEAVRAFVSLPPASIALKLNEWKAQMIASALSEASINRRLAAVRSLLKFSYRIGIAQTDGRGLVDGEKVTAYRDTRGIPLDLMKRLLALPGGDLLGLRDRAMLRLLCENVLRRAEICSLDVGDFQPHEKRLLVRGKGRGTQKEGITLSDAGAAAITCYLGASGHKDGALFRNSRGARLTGNGIHFIVRGYGKRIGQPGLQPHKLRHSGITAALEAGMDVREVQRLSRHKNIQTVLTYDDSRRDAQGACTRKLSALLEG